MATVIGLGVQFTANASGMTKGLSQVDRQLQQLSRQAGSVTGLFDQFASSSAAAAAAQQQIATDLAFLNSAFKTGQVSAEQYVTELQTIVTAANTSAAAFAEGARVTQQVATAEEKRATTLARLGQLLEQGAIDQQAYDRAAANASGANEAAAKAEEDRARALARAASITAANLTPQQKYDQEVQELNQHLQSGRISQETYNTALNKAQQSFAKAEAAAKKYDAAADSAGSGNTLAFNELSGILSAIPGPIGNVAGRLSGLASAGEGLSRVFAGGLSQGFGSLATAAAGLVNPLTLAVAGAAAFAAAAVAVGRGLVELEDRVERLGNLADQLGVSFEFIQTLEEAAERSGVSVDSLAGAMTRLQKTLAGADEESKAAQAALSRLGVGIEELNDLSQEDQIRLIGDRIAAIEDPAQRTAAALALFGRSGASLLPFFKNLGPAADDIERFGGALSGIDRQRIDDFGAGLDQLGVASSRAGELLVLPFAGLGEGIAKGTAEFLGGINAIIAPIGQILEPLFSNLGRVFELFGNGLGSLGRAIGAVLEPFGTVINAIGTALAPLNDGLVTFIKSTQDASVAFVEFLVSSTAIGVVAENIDAVLASIQSLSAGISDTLQPVFDIMQRIGVVISTAFTQVVEVVQGTLGRIGQIVGSAVAQFGEFTGITTLLTTFASAVTSAFNGIWDGIRSVVSGIGGFIEQVVSFAEQWLGITGEVENPVEASITLDVREPLLAATQFADEIGRAAEEAASLGEAGFQAALRYQQALEDIAQLQAEGEYNQEQAQRAAAQAADEFGRQRDAIKDAQKADQERAEAAKKAADQAIEADRKRADASLERQRVEQEFGGDSQRAEAAENVLAIEREIIRVEEEIRAAREAGDQAAADAAAGRLAQLDQAAQRERDIASGAAKAREDADKKAAKAVEDRKRAEEDKARRIADLEGRYQEELADIQRERIDALARSSSEALTGNDLRTTAGASQFLAIATGREDPAVEEYRKQLGKLDEIKREIAKANAAPVEIAG